MWRIYVFFPHCFICTPILRKRKYAKEMIFEWTIFSGNCNVHDILIILTKEFFFWFFFSFAFLYQVINDVTIFLLWKKKKKKQWIMAKRSYLSVGKKNIERIELFWRKKNYWNENFSKDMFLQGVVRLLLNKLY